MGKWGGGKVMMGGNMDGHLGYRYGVANVHPPLTRARHETCTAPLDTYKHAEYKRASHTAIDSVGGTCIALVLAKPTLFSLIQQPSSFECQCTSRDSHNPCV